ncbi:hypothetical protein K1719_008160 [Acacia pycnantha]|nr:hypothetical protein K1719_008160 [Acacia pycnantha]
MQRYPTIPFNSCKTTSFWLSPHKLFGFHNHDFPVKALAALSSLILSVFSSNSTSTVLFCVTGLESLNIL